MTVELHAITKTYNSQEGGLESIFNQFSHRFESSTLTILRGRSGAGKSTMLNIIAGIVLPQSGKVVINGAETTAFNESKRDVFRAANIGYIFQNFNLLPQFNVFENVYITHFASGNGGVELKKKGLELLEELGMIKHKSKFPHQLSEGERQRVAVARALVNNPEVVLADEPTASLDKKNGEIVKKLLMKSAEKKTVITASHDELFFNISSANLLEIN